MHTIVFHQETQLEKNGETLYLAIGDLRRSPLYLGASVVQ